jgi:hypothetical protein
MRVAGGLRAQSIGTNASSTFLVTPDGELYGWGSNTAGQMRHAPTPQEEQACPGGACVLVPAKLSPIP